MEDARLAASGYPLSVAISREFASILTGRDGGGRQLRAPPLRRYPRVYVRTALRLFGVLWPIRATFLRMGIGRWRLSIAADAMLRHARIGLRGDAQAPILRKPCFGASQGQRIAINVFRR